MKIEYRKDTPKKLLNFNTPTKSIKFRKKT